MNKYKMSVINKDLRRRVIEKGAELGFGHYCTAMSCIDACKSLYDDILRKDDVFIMGKGHGIIAVLPILEQKGKRITWKPYLDYDPENGIEATTGSLGHGLPIALGRAFGKKILGKPGNVYCMVGDGEIQEGSNWESLIIANKLNKQRDLDNLTLMVDWNKYQAVQKVKESAEIDAEDLTRKLYAFGCDEVMTLNGHDPQEMLKMKDLRKGVNAVILDTQKGKGIPFLERNPSFHVVYWHERPEEYKETLKYLGADENEINSAVEKMSTVRGH